MIEIFEGAISGFTTYKEEMSCCIKTLGHNLHVIILDAPINDLCIERSPKQETIKIPQIQRRETLGCILSLYIQDTRETVFIHNFAVSFPVLSLLKSYFPQSKLVYVIHDFIWASYLMGDVNLFKDLINHKKYVNEYDEIVAFYEDGLKSFNLVDKTVCLSMDTYKLLRDFYRIAHNRIAYVPNGLRDASIPKYASNNLRESMRLTERDKVFLYVGRLTKQKGIYCLLEAFELLCKEYPNAYLAIAGDLGSNFVVRTSNSILRKVMLLGRVRKQELYKWYCAADFGVIPSFYEQCSYTGIETKMFSLPSVVSDAFGVKCMFNATNSIMIQLHDNIDCVYSLYNGLKQAMNMHDGDIERLKNNARENYEKEYSFEQMCLNYKERLFDLLK